MCISNIVMNSLGFRWSQNHKKLLSKIKKKDSKILVKKTMQNTNRSLIVPHEIYGLWTLIQSITHTHHRAKELPGCQTHEITSIILIIMSSWSTVAVLRFFLFCESLINFNYTQNSIKRVSFYRHRCSLCFIAFASKQVKRIK